jgi:subtilisin family serine protease
LGGYNYVEPNVYTADSHGTLVLSTMGGYKENSLVGTAPDASYYLFITEDVASENPVEESLWVEAAERADSLGVDIINTSLGYFEFDNQA